ncbi:hypothetical protein MML48_3g00013693 [Holotrichia oblita]|uniref:Uncharacterized protein n=1 Tax=Holotrichia oblita TaxID=644536 RepID=A0ACB9TF71_HOLOL|nr:hypothetical protein MML48_3g00013693 [Holotrichia oblita]
MNFEYLTDMLEVYFECGKRLCDAIRIYQERFPDRESLHHKKFARLEANLRMYGSFKKPKKEVRTTDENLDLNVLLMVAENLKTSVREIANNIGSSSTTSIFSVYVIKIFYRQKTKARQKELQLKVKQDQDKTEANLAQQKLQSQPQSQQKLVVPNQCGSPKVNIIQNISIPTTEAEDNENKPDCIDPNTCKVSENSTSPQPGCSNENQAPKLKPVITCPVLNQHITLKHVTTSSSNGEKQIKVCNARKNLTTKCITTGQKLIVVSNPQSITTSSILQRTLTIPFVKNISVKNFDKFKIVTTNASTNIQLTTITTSGQPTTGKHKVVTVRTNPTVKKVIPLSQLQVLNAKGSIKVLPLGGKIVTKTNTGSTPVYIVNSGNMQCVTKSTTSTPIIMTCKTQDSLDNKSLLVLKNADLTANTKEAVDLSIQNEEVQVKEEIQDDNKSSVLTDIMEAVDVAPSITENLGQVQMKNEAISENIPSIEKLEEVKEELDVIKEEKTDLEDKEIFAESINVDETSMTNDSFSYITEDEKSCEQIIPDIKLEDSLDDPSNSSGTLDPTTGLYTSTSDDTACESLNIESKSAIITESMEQNLNN